LFRFLRAAPLAWHWRRIASVTVLYLILLGGCRFAGEFRKGQKGLPVEDSSCVVWACDPEGLADGVTMAVNRAAKGYHQETQLSITVVSGRRTLRHQAKLMAGMTRAQLEGMYCRNGYPSYITRIVSHMSEKGPPSADGVYDILRTRKEGYISAHLSGAAVDIRSRGANVPVLKRVLSEHGFAVLDERSLGIACIHATWRAAPRLIVWE
jgi:hypothetical protein